MDVFIQSCHASLEYDQARMFRDLGFSVYGEFDLGSKQRPKIAGITDRCSSVDDFPLIVLHQTADHPARMLSLLQGGKRVCLVGFGQSNSEQFRQVGAVCRTFQHAYVAAYSKKDYRLYLENGTPAAQVELIYFGKYLSDYQPWSGTNRICYATCNNIRDRAGGSIHRDIARLKRLVPTRLSGINSERAGGLGEISETEMRSMFQTSCCFASLGMPPGAILMSQMEAWCAGCPTASLDNGHGISEEGLPVSILPNATELIKRARILLNSETERMDEHLRSLEAAKRFDVRSVGPQWAKFIERIMAQ